MCIPTDIHVFNYKFGFNVLISFNPISIGLAIANRLVRDGAKVMVSSRKQKNVEKAVALLQKEYGDDCILGTVCHVGEDLDRKRLIQEVSLLYMYV